MQSLQNWQVVSNMTRRIWWIFIQPLKSKKKSIWWAIFSNFVEKMTFGSKNDMRNLVICNVQAVASLKICTLICYFCLYHIKFQLKKYRRILSWLWKKIQTLKKNWLFVLKMTWGNQRNLTWAVKTLKICTLMGYFCSKYVMFELKRYRGVEKQLMVSKMT